MPPRTQPPPSSGSSGAWQPNHAYKAGDVVSQGGVLYAANADHTSGGSFNAANWTQAVPDASITDVKVAAANKDGTAGTPSLRTLGPGAAQAAAGNDSRLSDARTPTAHASTHAPGGSDVLGGVYRGAWAATTAYKARDLVVQAGVLYSANANFTSTGAFSAADWTAVEPTDLSVKARHASDLLRTGGWMPTGAIDQTVVDRLAGATTTLSSGLLRVVGGCVVPGGRTVSAITFISGSTGATTPTNQWFCLIDRSNLSVLATTIDDTTNAWAASTIKTLSLATTIGGATPGGTWTPANDVEVYVGINVTAATPPNMIAATGTVALATVAPALSFSGNSGLTGPGSLPATVTTGAMVGSLAMAWFT